MPKTAPLPLYLKVKRHIRARIDSGHWRAAARVPSENEIVKAFGVSRMTANRALRELTDEGVLVRVAGVGSFVADRHAQAHPLRIRSIAEEIRERGHSHRAEVVTLEPTSADAALAELFGIAQGDALFRSVMVHFEDERPIQIEDRHVLPRVAPQYLHQDYRHATPYDYLVRVAPLQEVEHTVRAVVPDESVRKRLDVARGEPCLLLIRRTWTHGAVASVAHLHHPGSRYQLSGRFRP